MIRILKRLGRSMSNKLKGKKDLCKRCGACCLAGGGDIYHWCEYLFFKKDKIPTCMIYDNRIGKKITGGVCVLRYKTKYDYPGCPLNTGKPVHPFFDKDKPS